jgi:hypothetical protein
LERLALLELKVIMALDPLEVKVQLALLELQVILALVLLEVKDLLEHRVI